MTRSNRARIAAAVAAAGLAVAVAAPVADAFDGASLARMRIGVTWNGTAYPRINCAGGTDGFCMGTITIKRGVSILGRAPFAVRSGDAPSVEVPLPPTRGGRRQAILAGGRSVTVIIVAHDLFFAKVTTRSSAQLANG